MANLLYAWELGGELGHLSQALPLALAAKARGHEIILALKDVSRAESVLAGHGVTYLQAPVWLPVIEGLPRFPANYTEILFQNGYLDASGLLGVIKAWRALYALTKPALVMADHAPTALLAALSMGIPRTMLGTGFFSPIRVSPLPSIRPWQDIPPQRLLDGERAVLQAINYALTQLGSAPLRRVADLFPAPAEECLLSFAELDHYPHRENTEYLGTALSVAGGVTPIWPEGDGKKLFAYLKPKYVHTEKVLAQLASSGARVLIYAGGLPQAMVARYASPRLKFSEAPFNIIAASQQCDAAVCHAGHGTVSAMLLAGKPVLLLPIQLEQFLLSKRVVALGAGLLVDPNTFDQDFAGKLRQLLAGESLAEHARAFATKYQAVSQQDLLEKILVRCESLIGAGPILDAIAGEAKTATPSPVGPSLVKETISFPEAEPTDGERNALVALFNQGDYAKAEALARNMTIRFPNHGFGWKVLGGVIRQQGRLGDALAPMQKAAELLPGDAEAYSNLGVVLRALGRQAEAERSYRRAVEIRADFAEAHSNLGGVLQELGRHAEAEASYRRAVEIRPDFAEAHSSLGVVLKEQERYGEAEASFRRGLEIKPNSAGVLLNLGALLAIIGRQAEAEANFRQSLALLRAQLDNQTIIFPVLPRPPMDLDAARTALFAARSMLMAAGLPFFLCNGTFLGIVRNGDLLPHDKDLDIGLPWEVDRQHLLAVLGDGGEFQLADSASLSEDGRPLYISLRHRDTNITLDLFFHRPDGNHFLCGFKQGSRLITSRPRQFEIGTLTWQGVEWPVPTPAAQYLTDFYGEEWTVPDPYFDTVLSSRCQTPESRDGRLAFGYLRLFKRLQNREWDKAMGYCRQMLCLQNDDFISDLLAWVKNKQDGSRVNNLPDSLG